MSSKFNPSYHTRQPPPQCKKSKQNIDAPSIIGPSPMIDGQPLLLTFQLEWLDGFTWRRLNFNSYVPMNPTNLWSGGQVLSGINYVILGVRYNFTTNTFQVLAESKLGGVDYFTVASQVFEWNGRRPFTFPQTWCDMTGFGDHRIRFVTCSLTS